MNQTDHDATICAVRASDLCLVRGRTTLLDHISLAIPPGAVVGLVGANGAGKTSLLRCLAGLQTPSSGGAALLGCQSAALSDAVRERLGYVAQTPDLFDWMDVDEMLATIGRAYARWDPERAASLAHRLGLRLQAPIRDLSGGDQQKLAVVLALAHDPDLLLLDEPVASLDPLARREFMRALFDGDGQPARQNPRTILISSHILTDLERLVSHVAFLRDGRLQLLEAWDTLLEWFRLQPADAAGFAPSAIVSRNPVSAEILVDMRGAAPGASPGRVLTLDALFAELNA